MPRIELPDWVKPGASFRFDYSEYGGPDNPHHGRKFHVRAIVDGLVVLREWSRSKQYWRYSIEDPVFFHHRAKTIVIMAKGPVK